MVVMDLLEAEADMSDDLKVYEKQGFGHRMGFGDKPALLIIDFIERNHKSPWGSHDPTRIRVNAIFIKK